MPALLLPATAPSGLRGIRGETENHPRIGQTGSRGISAGWAQGKGTGRRAQAAGYTLQGAHCGMRGRRGAGWVIPSAPVGIQCRRLNPAAESETLLRRLMKPRRGFRFEPDGSASGEKGARGGLFPALR